MRNALAGLCVALLFAGAAKAGETYSESGCLKAIELFRAAPESDVGKGAASYFVRFAEESNTVTIDINADHLPWIGVEGVPHAETLLAAYIAGSLRSQLETGIDRNDAYSGLLMTISVYRRLQEDDKEFRIVAVERLVESHKRGELSKHSAVADEG